MPSPPPPPSDDTAPATPRQTLALQVAVLTQLRLAAAARGERWTTLKMLSARLAKARAALAALQQQA